MNETLKEFSLAGDKLMPEMHLRPDYIKNLKKQEIHDTFIKAN